MASRTSPPGTDSSPVVDIEDFVVESSVGWRNGSGQASPPVQYRQRDVRGISGGEGVDGPAGGGRSSFEVSVPQQRGDEQNERGHLSLPSSIFHCQVATGEGPPNPTPWAAQPPMHIGAGRRSFRRTPSNAAIFTVLGRAPHAASFIGSRAYGCVMW